MGNPRLKTLALLSLATFNSSLTLAAAMPVTSVAVSLTTLQSYVSDPLAQKQEPYLSVETFPLPNLQKMGPDLTGHLSTLTGVAGTDLLGIRVKIGMPDGYTFESMEASLADAVFLVQERSFMEAIGHLLARVTRFLLFGQLVSVGTDLEVPGSALTALMELAPVGDESSVSLHTKREVRAERTDQNTTDHGEYVVCRFLVAANAWSELVGIQIVAHNRVRDATVRYKIPRLKLPEPALIEPAPEVEPTKQPPREVVARPARTVLSGTTPSPHD